MPKDNLTVLLGAGASLPFGVPSTKDLTTAICKQEGLFSLIVPDQIVPTKKILEHLHNDLLGFYESVNFEHMLNALEVITSLKRSWQPKTVDEYKTVEAYFCGGPRSLLEHYFYDDRVILNSKDVIYQTIHNEFYKVCSDVTNHPKFQTLSNFWKAVEEQFDLNIGTLNYDTLLEKVLKDIEEGFEMIPGESFARFNPIKLRNSNKRLMHLHGSIHYGYPRYNITTLNQNIFVDDFHDLYRFEDASKTVETWSGRSQNTSQAGRQAIIGPLITGLDKTAKILFAYPYSVTYQLFAQCVETCPRLLIIGYGFLDKHINTIIRRLTNIHDTKRRVVIVDLRPEDEWKPFEWNGNDQMFNTIGILSKESRPLSNLSYINPWESSDKCCRVYLLGTLDAYKKRQNDIISFLK